MAIFNYSRKEIDAKIVYYGPGFCGKTTNLQFIHEHLKPSQRGKMVSLATDEDVTLFFDFLPIELENVRGFRTRFHLYTVPGQVYYGATRRAVLTGADGVIFVADSQVERMEDNLHSLKELEQNLRHYAKKIETIPFIVQYNKRDLPNIVPVEELNNKINYLHVPYFESVAVEGKGVFESLTMICRMVLKAIKDGVEARGSAAMASSASEATGTDASRVERGISRPEPAGATQGAAPARTLRPEGGVPQIETPRPARIPSLAGAEPKGETSRIVGRSIISRIWDKKKLEPSARVDEEPKEKILAPKDKMRIFFGAEPRVSSPNSLEIPLTLEIDGLRKTLSFILAIRLEQLKPKGD